MIVWRRLAEIVAEHGRAALVGVHAAKGSTPREAGARMIVRPDGAFHGTIGGGQLEWQALEWAKDALERGESRARLVDQALGPDLGQCCGGRVTLLIETFGAEDRPALNALAEAEARGPFQVSCRVENGRVKRTVFPSPLVGEGRVGGAGAELDQRGAHTPTSTSSPQGGGEQSGSSWRESYGERTTPLLLFGAGHVGRALVLALAPLPFRVQWIDSRDAAFPAHIPANVAPILSQDPASELAAASDDAFILVMTHDHALDLDITAAALRRPFPYVGLIGSATKRARFERRFREIGLPEGRIRSLVCPIGISGVSGKEPAIIAAATVAQVLQVRENGASTFAEAFPVPTEASCP